MHNDVIRPRITAGVLAHSDHVHTCRPLLDIIIGTHPPIMETNRS